MPLVHYIHRGDGATACGIPLDDLDDATELEAGSNPDIIEGCWDCLFALLPDSREVRAELDARHPGILEGDVEP